MTEKVYMSIVKRCRSILEESSRCEESYWDVAERRFDEKLFQSSFSLANSCRMTTESCCVLAEQSRIYDASILRRTIIQGSLKLIYLLSASDNNEELKRVKEYMEELPKKQFASNDQPIQASFRAKRYGSESKRRFIKKHVIDYIDIHKTQPNEGKYLADIHNKWAYLNLSSRVAKENKEWAELHLRMDVRYTSANDYVHWNATGCFEVMNNLALASSSKYWGVYISRYVPIDIMLDMCSLAFARGEVLAKRIGGSHKELEAIVNKNKGWLKKIGNLREKVCQEIMAMNDCVLDETTEGNHEA